ncbi:MAG: quinone oxidoreductase [Anaerolineae bacterium]|nr:quinone oxidoreductase [Anaerolineae bacterium]
MKAVQVHQTGGPEVLSYEEIEMPQPGPGEARLKIEAIGLNFVDVYRRRGLYKANLPLIPGEEAAGVVDAVGPGVTEVQVGQRAAYAMRTGAYAEYAVVPAWTLVPIPEAIRTEDAAAVLLQGLTAHYLCYSTYPLRAGETALVHAAAGGVGLLLVQIAKGLGARVIGTVSTEEKAQLARDAGADDVILYTQADFEAETKRLTDKRGVSVVYDSVGRDTFDKSLNCLRPRGMMVLYGQSSGPVPPFDPQTLNAKGSLFLTRPSLGHYIADHTELLQRSGDLFQWMQADDLQVRIDTVFPLADAANAQRYIEARKTKGKVLLIP